MYELIVCFVIASSLAIISFLLIILLLFDAVKVEH